jgi:hypothetical protein
MPSELICLPGSPRRHRPGRARSHRNQRAGHRPGPSHLRSARDRANPQPGHLFDRRNARHIQALMRDDGDAFAEAIENFEKCPVHSPWPPRWRIPVAIARICDATTQFRSPAGDPRVLQDLQVNDLARLPWFFKRYPQPLPRLLLPRELPGTAAPAISVLAGSARVAPAMLDLPHRTKGAAKVHAIRLAWETAAA